VAVSLDAARELVLQVADVGVNHDPHELLEAHRRLPAELLPGLARVAQQDVHL
jgi:hypothetical protein